MRTITLWFAIGLLSSSAALSQVPPSGGLDIGGLRLGMTEEQARKVPGISLDLIAKYRTFVIYKVDKFSFLGDAGTLTIQFDEGRGLTKLEQRWSYKDEQKSQARKQFQTVSEWAEIPAESIDREVKKLAGNDMPLAMASRRTADSIVDVDALIGGGVLGSGVAIKVYTAQEPPSVAMKGEAPLRHQYSDADDAFADSIERAKKAHGILSPYHGIYSPGTCNPNMEVAFISNTTFTDLNLRMKSVIWSEGGKVYSHWGLAKEARELEVTELGGQDTITFQMKDGGKKVMDVFVIDVVEHTNKGPESMRYWFAKDELIMVEKTFFGTGKEFFTWRRCERL